MFITRLQTLLEYYISSRHVATFADLISLLITDHVKPQLSHDCLQHVLSVENTTEIAWLKHTKLAEVIDIYVASHASNFETGANISHLAIGRPNRYFRYAEKPRDAQQFVGKKQNSFNATKPERRCFQCDSRLHVAKHCPHRPKAVLDGATKKPQIINV